MLASAVVIEPQPVEPTVAADYLRRCLPPRPGHVWEQILAGLRTTPARRLVLLRLGLHRLPIGEFPLLRGLAPVLAAYDGAAELERGLDILLTGLTTTVTPPG